jgi:hypothetical protein
MKTSQSLAQLAIVGIAAGFLSNAALADEKKSAMPAKDAPMSAPAKDGSKAPPAAPGKEAAMAGHAAGDSAMAMPSKHECKGMNECKGMGGCKMSKKDLKNAAKKMDMPMEKAGKAHDCKGKNECKGLGGCKS